MIAASKFSLIRSFSPPPGFFSSETSSPADLPLLKLPVSDLKVKTSAFHDCNLRSNCLASFKPMESSNFRLSSIKAAAASDSGCDSNVDAFVNHNDCSADLGKLSTKGKSTNIVWHKCSVEKTDRQELLQQKGCVIWITGLSGSGKSTVACAITQALHSREKLTYVLDGDNVRHGLNRDLSFKAEDRAENIRRIGEVAKLFADAGVICIACLISPYRKDRDACRALLAKGEFIEVFMDVPLEVCEARDPKGLYKLARAGKIKGFTGIDDPYEQPLDCEGFIKRLRRYEAHPVSAHPMLWIGEAKRGGDSGRARGGAAVLVWGMKQGKLDTYRRLLLVLLICTSVAQLFVPFFVKTL